MWDPSLTAPRGPDREMGAKHAFKAHDGGGVLGMTFFLAHRTEGEPGELPLMLATTGEDKKVALWDCRTWKAAARSQPMPKAACHSVCYAPWGGAGLGVLPSLVLASGDVPSLLGLNPSSGEVTELLSLVGQVDPGQKKVPKIYHAAAHPTKCASLPPGGEGGGSVLLLLAAAFASLLLPRCSTCLRADPRSAAAPPLLPPSPAGPTWWPWPATPRRWLCR